MLYAGGSLQGRRSSPSPVCQQAKFLLSDSGEPDSPAGSVPPSWVMYGSGTQRILQCEIQLSDVTSDTLEHLQNLQLYIWNTYIIYSLWLLEVHLSFCNYMNGNFETLKMQVNGPFTLESTQNPKRLMTAIIASCIFI